MKQWKQQIREKLRHIKGLRTIAVVVMICATLLSFTLPALARTKYVITDGDQVIVCISSSSDPGQVIKEAGLELGKSDTYTTTREDGVSQIQIKRVQMIAIHDGGELTVVGSYGGTVADVLASLDITLSDTDVLSCPLDMETYDGMSVEISRVKVENLSYEETIPHGVKTYEDDSLEPGEEVILVEGRDGLRQVEAQVTYEDGEEVDRTVLSELVVTAPVDRVVTRGVDRGVKEQEHSGEENYRPSHTTQVGNGSYRPGASGSTPVLPTENLIPGTNLAYKELKYMEATAYYNPEGNPGITATGTKARVGAIAVDPTVIPLGTKLYIATTDGAYIYGVCTAEDTGGAIKGDIVDLFFNTKDECIQFGRRNIVVYILE